MPDLRPRAAAPAAGALPLVLLAAVLAVPPAAAQPTHVPALDAEAFVVSDSFGIPTVCASSEHDAMVLLGWLHARDRLFQMDFQRRLFSGTLAELIGSPALSSDVQLRTLGLRRAAEESWAGYQALAGETGSNAAALLEAYAAGVNRRIALGPLPPEYAVLELSAVEPWTPVDSLVMAKGLAFGLSFDLEDIDRTEAFLAYSAVGQSAGFDGAALFFEDVFRSAPFDDTISIPGFFPAPATAAARAGERARAAGLDPRLPALARGYRERAAEVPLLARALDRAAAGTGSNWWVVSGERTASGHPVLANDPHLGLDNPAIFYEAHLMVSSAPRCGLPASAVATVTAGAAAGPPRAAAPGSAPSPGTAAELNVNGVTFAGVPGVVQGCNERICWGSTTNPMDVTDVYQEEVVFAGGVPAATLFDGVPEPVVLIPQVFLVNQIGGGTLDDLADAGIGPLDGGLTVVVPRRNRGPLVALDPSSQPALGLSVQYTGWRDTYELEAFLRWMRAGDLDDFVAGLQYFDVGSQNWVYADVDGHIAYYTSGELPLREDLEATGVFSDGGIPPYLIRDGTGAFEHEWVPAAAGRPRTHAVGYRILDFANMPQLVDPASGWIVNANNDPIGTTLDNDPLNQVIVNGGGLYLSPGYSSLRAGRIAREVEALLAGGHLATAGELAAIQANNALLDAELILPFLSEAFDNAADPAAPDALKALGLDPEVGEAIARLRGWDFTTPTGIPEGYDPGDDPDNLPQPSAGEIANSVAATLWAAWRGQAIENVVDASLQRVGLGGFSPGSSQAYVALAHLLRTFDQGQGVGASGIDFFPGIGIAREDARDLLLLESLRDALDLLASSEFVAAFGNSTSQDDYRWGKLHRVTFDHPLGAPFSIPPAGGFDDLAPALPGIPRAGGYEAVDASSHGARGASAHQFTFGSGPARRFVGVLDPAGIDAEQAIPGGQSGVLGSPHHTDQLPLWLTNRYHPVRLSPAQVAADAASEETFTRFGVPCTPSPTTMCLGGDRFRVTVQWRTGGGASGPGRVVPTVANDRSGLFWFFADDNWEMLVKVLDGCPVNDRFWVFAASATNVEWTLLVEDTASGEPESYFHPFGPPSPAVTDTAAFDTCP